MKTYTLLEVAIEVAWQMGDSLENSPRAESRWKSADIAQEIINKGIINDSSTDIDEIINAYLTERGLK
jgi:hypothetical protein